MADYLSASIAQIDHNTVLRQDYAVTGNTRGDRELLVGAQVTPFTVNWHGVLWTCCVVEEQQLAAVAVTRSVNFSFLISDNLSTNLGQHVDDAKDSFLVTRNQGRGEDDEVTITYRDLTVLAACHTGQRRHRLSLSTGSDEQHLVRSHLGGFIDRDDRAAWNLKEAHLLRDFHVAHHRATVERNLTAGGDGRVDSRLYAVDVRCKGRDNHTLLSTRHQTAEGCRNIALRGRHARNIGVSGITQHEVNAFIAITRQCRKIRRTVVQRSLVQLNVTGVDDVAGWGA